MYAQRGSSCMVPMSWYGEGKACSMSTCKSPIGIIHSRTPCLHYTPNVIARLHKYIARCHAYTIHLMPLQGPISTYLDAMLTLSFILFYFIFYLFFVLF